MNYVVKSTNEHPYHRTVYSYSKADWDGLRDHLRDVPWLDILTEWVKISIDCYIPHRKFQLTPHTLPWFTLVPLPLHTATIISISTIRKRLLKITNCFVIHVITVESPQQGPIMPKQLVALLHLSWRICNSIRNMGKSNIPPFNGPEVLITSTDKANLIC